MIIYTTGDGKAFAAADGSLLVLDMALSLITDRTASDVAYVQTMAAKIRDGTATAEELAAWNTAALKGSYNHTDLNRVGAAMGYVADRLNSFGYAVAVSPKTDWTEADCPAVAGMERYLADLARLRGVLQLVQTTPAVPADLERMTYAEANNIEKILEDIDLLLTNSAQAWYYSGDLVTGEV